MSEVIVATILSRWPRAAPVTSGASRWSPNSAIVRWSTFWRTRGPIGGGAARPERRPSRRTQVGDVGRWTSARDEPGAAVVEVEVPFLVVVEIRRAGVVRVPAGPLEALLVARLKAVVAYAAVDGDDIANFVHNLAGMVIVPVVAQTIGQRLCYLPVLACVTRRSGDRSDPLDAPFRVGKGPVFLRRGRCREDYVSVLGGLRDEDVLDDEEVQLLEGLLGVLDIGLR